MYHFQRQILKEAEKYSKPQLDGSVEGAMANLTDTDLKSEGGTVSEAVTPKVGQAFDVGGSKMDMGPKLFGTKPKMFAIIPRKGTNHFTLSILSDDLKPSFSVGDYESFDKALAAAIKLGKAGKVLSVGATIKTESFEPLDEDAATIVAHQSISKGTEELNKRTAENLRKFRVPPSFISNYGTLRKRKNTLPGSHIMWGKDDRDLDVIPAKDIQNYLKDGWVIIEGTMVMGDDTFLIIRED